MQVFLNSHYIDLIIIAVLIYFLTEAFRHGFWIILADFVSFFGSLILSLSFYKQFASFLKSEFSLNNSVINAFSYMILAIIFEALLGFLSGVLIYYLPQKIKRHKLNYLLGLIPAFGEGVAIVSFVLTLVIALPVKPQIKTDVINSKIASFLLERTSLIDSYFDEVFGGVINDSLTYFTIKPDSGESINLNVNSFNLVIDDKAEKEMFALLNSERNKIAINDLKIDKNLSMIARDYAKDMWTRKYFSHYSPEKENIADRLSKNNFDYQLAGENLALAPTVKTAHVGLMNSKGHRENMLNPNFKKVGVGAVNNGYYGIMFVQVFAD